MRQRLGRERILLLSLRSILLVDWVQFTGSLGSGFPFIELARVIICWAFDPQCNE